MWERKLIEAAALEPFAPPGGLKNTTDLGLALMAQQKSMWPELSQGVEALAKVQTRTIDLNAWPVTVQFNPIRAVSSLARTDAGSIARRPCFLCAANQSPVQLGVRAGEFILLGNPMPIVPNHLTVVHEKHAPQQFTKHLDALLRLAKEMADGFHLVYNGPRCGASAPDHMHFQAVPAGCMPVERMLAAGSRLAEAHLPHDTRVSLLADADAPEQQTRRLFIVHGRQAAGVASAVGRLLRRLPDDAESAEPLMNVFAKFEVNAWTVGIFPRAAHRPRRYFLEGPEQFLLSPGILDMAGLLITVRREDFDRLSAAVASEVYRETVLTAARCLAAIKSLGSHEAASAPQ